MELVQNVAFNYPVLMVNVADHITGKTGLALAIQLSKAGGPFTVITPVVIERGFGEYVLVLTTDMVDTLGAFSLHIEGAGADPFDSLDQVVPQAAQLVPPHGTMVPLDALKLAIGIPLSDTSQDEHLAQLIEYAATVVEGETQCRFGLPAEQVEFQQRVPAEGPLYLLGHIDDSPEANTATSEITPSTSLLISRRMRYTRDSWTMLVEGTDWERRGDQVEFLSMDGWWWGCLNEFRLSYLDGYENAPADIKQVIVEIASNQYFIDANMAGGAAGIKSETLGDFSYAKDLTVQGSGGAMKYSQFAWATINRYKKLVV
jgi:hypothetical protein